jgi:hypothetical protein
MNGNGYTWHGSSAACAVPPLTITAMVSDMVSRGMKPAAWLQWLKRGPASLIWMRDVCRIATILMSRYCAEVSFVGGSASADCCLTRAHIQNGLLECLFHVNLVV